MKKKNRKASYWQEVRALFTRAGALGIVGLFIDVEKNRASETQIIYNQSARSFFDEEDIHESLTKIRETA